MDFFDVISIAGEAYCETKKDMKSNNDTIEILATNFNKFKSKIDKLCKDDMDEFNKKRDIFWNSLD